MVREATTHTSSLTSVILTVPSVECQKKNTSTKWRPRALAIGAGSNRKLVFKQHKTLTKVKNI